MHYGRALKIVRSSRNLSQKDLGNAVGLDPSYISLIEKDKRVPALEVLEKIVSKLKIPIHLFFLLASEPEDVKKLPSDKTKMVAETLMHVLFSMEKQER